MSSLRRIICLENSWREDERCISGIDMDTGKWVRPVCDDLYPEDGRVPQKIRFVQDREPELLDILGIPLANTGKDFGFQSENLSVLSGEWSFFGKAQPSDLPPYLKSFKYILHNSVKSVKPSYLRTLPLEKRHTVQLIKATRFYVDSSVNQRNNRIWKGSIGIDNGQFLENLTITDPVLVKKLDAGYLPSQDCLIVVSLNMPWSSQGWQGEKSCWKLIAGVIDLVDNQSCTIENLISQIDLEVKRVGWTVDQESSYIDRNFHKKNRSLLNLDELQQFVIVLESLPSQAINIPNPPIKPIPSKIENRENFHSSSKIKPNPIQSSIDNYRIYPANRPNSGHLPQFEFGKYIVPSVLCFLIGIFFQIAMIILIASWIGFWIRHRSRKKKLIACQVKGWKISTDRDIERNKNFIGLGENELYAKLSDSNLDVLRQVQIDESYKADFVCFNNETDKLCVVEVDGQQHFNDQDQIDRDNLRMNQLASIGVPTIRFLNQYAKNNPMICVNLIRDLLK